MSGFKIPGNYTGDTIAPPDFIDIPGSGGNFLVIYGQELFINNLLLYVYNINNKNFIFFNSNYIKK